MAKKAMKISNLLDNVTDRVEEAVNEPAENIEQQTREHAIDQENTDDIEIPVEEVLSAEDNKDVNHTAEGQHQIELSIDDDINMYSGITKPVSFALPKDIKRALDAFVDDYNDARPTSKTTQAKVVAQALRNFLSNYK